jgi:hypothetical protein
VWKLRGKKTALVQSTAYIIRRDGRTGTSRRRAVKIGDYARKKVWSRSLSQFQLSPISKSDTFLVLAKFGSLLYFPGVGV